MKTKNIRCSLLLLLIIAASLIIRVQPRVYTMADVEALKHTDTFCEGTLMHIFDGTLSEQGKASGYHYDKISGSKGTIIEGTRSDLDQHGVYTAYVMVEGVKKNHYSTFFPDHWSPQQVVDAINAAREDALKNHRNPTSDLWIGYTRDIEINMYLDKHQMIISAFPIYEEDET